MVGCCGGKAKSSCAQPIVAKMGETKIPKFDTLFTDASAVLENAEHLRSGLEDSKATMMALSGAYTLKDGTLSNAFENFLWSVGASVGADKMADSVKPVISLTEEPHFNIEIDPAFAEEHKKFVEAAKCYIDTVVAAPTKCTTIAEKLTSVVAQANELKATAQADATEAGLGAMDAVKAIKTIGTNISNLTKGSAKLTQLKDVIPEAASDIKALATALAQMLKDAPAKAKDGKEKSATTMAEFCEKMQAGEKLAPAEAKTDRNLCTHEKRVADGRALPSADAAEEGAAGEEKAAEEGAAEDKPAAEAAAAEVAAAIADAVAPDQVEVAEAGAEEVAEANDV